MIEIVCAIPLHDDAFLHHTDMIGQRECFVLIMGHQHRGGSQLF